MFAVPGPIVVALRRLLNPTAKPKSLEPRQHLGTEKWEIVNIVARA
jgi:hypothetical protein